MLIDRTLPSFLDAISSAEPTPGGGSAAALAGATGAALLAMVAGMPKTRTNAIVEREALDQAHTELLALQETLVQLIDRDASAYDLVVAAFRKPKATDEDKVERKAAIHQTLPDGQTEIVPAVFDRVCITPGKGALILDYKTTRGGTDAELRDKYLAQMTAYRDAVARLTSIPPGAIRCQLIGIWTDVARVAVVDVF